MTDNFVPWHLQYCLSRLPTRFWKRASLCAGLYVFILTCRTWQRSEVQSMFSQGWYMPRVMQFSRITMILMRSNHVRKHMLRLMFFSRHVNAIIHKNRFSFSEEGAYLWENCYQDATYSTVKKFGVSKNFFFLTFTQQKHIKLIKSEK